MSDSFKVLTKNLIQSSYFNKIIPIQSFNIFAIQFCYKSLFLLFLVPDFREKRESSLDYCVRQRKSSLTPIHPTKMIDLNVNGFHLMRKVLFFRVFQVFKCHIGVCHSGDHFRFDSVFSHKKQPNRKKKKQTRNQPKPTSFILGQLVKLFRFFYGVLHQKQISKKNKKNEPCPATIIAEI